MLGPYRAGSRRLGRRHGVTPRGLTGSRSRPGCHRRVAIGWPGGTHHIDRRRFARNRRASCDDKAAQNQYGGGAGIAVPARSAFDHFPSWLTLGSPARTPFTPSLWMTVAPPGILPEAHYGI